MQAVRLSLESPRLEGQTLVVAGVLQHPEGHRQRLWWSLPADWGDALTPWADPFVVAFLFPMMQWRRDVFVEGSVSPSLLTNLEHYMTIWHAWMPDRYQPVVIRASQEVEAPPPAEEGQTVAAFSCGVDSSFMLYRHCRRLVGRRTRRITAAVVMHGFDIWLDQENADGMYADLLNSARAMTASLGVPCIPVRSNFHELETTWDDSLGTHLVGGLQLLAGRFDSALIANEKTYTQLSLPCASHPVINPHLSSRHFQVIDDGGEAMRFEKIQIIADWPQAMRHLRVCFENPASAANCCRCNKCVYTILSFRAADVQLPPAFSRDISNRQIRHLRLRDEICIYHWLEIFQGAKRLGLDHAGWVWALRVALWRDRWRRTWRRFLKRFLPLRNRIRKLFRGSPLSRKQLARQAGRSQSSSSLS